MPKNKRGGNKAKRGGNKHSVEETNTEIQRPIDSRQKYGVVTKVLGNCRFEVETDGKKYQISLPGKLRGRRGGRITLGSVLLYDIGDLSEVEGRGGYAICIYNERQIKTLRKEGTIPKDANEETRKIDSIFNGTDLNLDTVLDSKESTKNTDIFEEDEIDLDAIGKETKKTDISNLEAFNIDDI